MKTKPLTAAEFKRRFCNKAAKARASMAVDIREAVGAKESKATAKDKARLRNYTMRTEPNPGNYHKGNKAVMAGALSLHKLAFRPVTSL